MKRFYKAADIIQDGEGYGVQLDGRSVKTPGKVNLIAPNEKLARLSAEEWNAQGEHILPETMPLTQLLNTRLDHIVNGGQRPALEREILKFINTDLLCYRADAPEDLVARQDQHWQKPLDWFERETGLRFEVTQGLAALTQDKAIHERMAAEIAALDDDRFTIAQMITPACSSSVLALAFVKHGASVDDLMACSFLEEDHKFDLYNEAVHGGDPLTEKKRKALRRDLEAASAYLNAL